ncbi:MAG: hypothetical protein GWN83_07125, partial [Gemmatimonadetes bacterium]|nr:hypothetical protein [Gemmatimonadota bacterium]
RYAIDLLTAARGFFPTCPFPYQGPGGPVPIDPVLRAAISHLDHWIRTGVAPPDAPLIEMEPSPTNPSLGVIQRDAFGNALGGIRMPQQDVPTGRNSPSFGCKIQHPVVGEIVLATFPQWDAFDGGDDPAVDDTDLWNDTEPDSPHDLYGNHGQYVSRFVRAVRAVERDGYILNFDARRLRRGAASSDIGKEPTQTPEADDNDLPAPARTRSRRPSSAGSERTPAGPEHRGPPKLPPQANAAAGNRGNGRGNA